jgi:hypothetical protein
MCVPHEAAWSPHTASQALALLQWNYAVLSGGDAAGKSVCLQQRRHYDRAYLMHGYMVDQAMPVELGWTVRPAETQDIDVCPT